MEVHRDFTEWAVSRGVKINGIAAHKFPGRGLGIIAEKSFKASLSSIVYISVQEGDTILTVPISALRTLLTVPKSISIPIGAITVHGLLAASLSLDTTLHYSAWRAVLPTAESFKESVPLLWHTTLQALLPSAALSLLKNQQAKISKDWSAVSSAFPSLSYETYQYNWLLVNTRTFYFTSPLIKLSKPVNRDDCMALQPFADYFNHADIASAEALFSSQGYSIAASCSISKGDEIYISYGNHSNDFLLAEYGFSMESNKWDEADTGGRRVCRELCTVWEGRMLQDADCAEIVVLAQWSVAAIGK
ncbi:Ribosomal lysine N-methyltransferase 2 [Hyphodiscus hymeniophilus]|uniref:Ribosomal lysine N-methyltransferase 2 n=1 Tax=Hyphodiscus hymeniophilus TaxID=353542 RepID=A0A9P6VM02_9HELO|nr:Ribosomal lysine N-methyltransferase 2 [Hyphodiscus hymeniophilus]